jgi:N-acetylglutamate synthase-like GNAT family acetyltransferase
MSDVLSPGLGSRKVRPMDAADVGTVTSLLRILPWLYPSGDAWLSRRLDDVVQGRAHCSLREQDGRVIAAAITTPKGPQVVKLSTFFVAEDCRHRGVGAGLLDSVLGDVDRAGVREIYVTVAHHLAAPLAELFLPRGFIPCALEIDRYGQGRHELVLTRLSI